MGNDRPIVSNMWGMTISLTKHLCMGNDHPIAIHIRMYVGNDHPIVLCSSTMPGSYSFFRVSPSGLPGSYSLLGRSFKSAWTILLLGVDPFRVSTTKVTWMELPRDQTNPKHLALVPCGNKGEWVKVWYIDLIISSHYIVQETLNLSHDCRDLNDT